MEDKVAKRTRIGIDGHMIGDHSGGNETYYQNILQHMDFPSDWDVYLFLKPEADASRFEKQFNILRFTSSNAMNRNFIELPKMAKHLGLDLLHTQYFIPFFCPCPVVCTIHDICFEHFKDIFTRSEYFRQKILIPYAAKQSKIIFTVSEFSKQDIAEKYRIEPDRIIVTHNAVDKAFRKLNETELDERHLRTQFGIGEDPYILTVGNLQPRKNLPRLIEAFMRLKAKNREVQTDTDSCASNYKLVIVGKKAWMYDEIMKSADSEDIVFTDYVTESDLVRLYNAAEIFIYPSFFEGFGLPPLEAMACGTPVAVANATSLPEVVGDAGMYFDPMDVDSIQHAMEILLSDEHLRKEMVDRGLMRVEEFSWKESAQKIVEQYEECIKSTKKGQ